MCKGMNIDRHKRDAGRRGGHEQNPGGKKSPVDGGCGEEKEWRGKLGGGTEAKRK